MMTISAAETEHLYLHVPFCRGICYYCGFVHSVYRPSLADEWLDALDRELKERPLPKGLKTVYIGGGTPTCLSPAQLERLLAVLDGQPYEEYTAEADPDTLSEEKADILVRHGVNRVSVGMQSSDDGLLKAIGRRHVHADTVRTVKLLKERGIRNISLDILYALPGQTMNMLEKTVSDAVSLSPAHLSVYSLTVEEGTVFAKRGIQAADEETEADMYEYLCRVLPAYGYERYETANFAKPGYCSKHNLCYWNYRNFRGVSAGASGKEGRMRYDNTRSLREYLEDPLKRQELYLSEEEARFEAVMMNLRKKEGLCLKDFEEMFGLSVTDAFGARLRNEIGKGNLILSDTHLFCSERGYDILNSILSELL